MTDNEIKMAIVALTQITMVFELQIVVADLK
jgi:hypothetical protein